MAKRKKKSSSGQKECGRWVNYGALKEMFNGPFTYT